MLLSFVRFLRFHFFFSFFFLLSPLLSSCSSILAPCSSLLHHILSLPPLYVSLPFISKHNNVIHLHDKRFVPFISSGEIEFAIQEMARRITDDHAEETPVFIGVLNGAFMVVSDLVKHFRGQCEVQFVKMASYEGTASTGTVQELIGLFSDLSGRSVILVEDIVDTGATIVALKAMLKEHNPKHVKIATLFLKPEVYYKDVRLDYVGIRIPNKFIVGYGLDYDGLGRNLPDVYQLAD